MKSYPRAAAQHKIQLLTLLQPSQAIRMKLPRDAKWSLRSCVKILLNPWYASRHYRCNRCQLRTTAETPLSPLVEQDLLQNHTD